MKSGSCERVGRPADRQRSRRHRILRRRDPQRTFGLGVLEALKQRDLLKKLHLTKVAGGGYSGAWLSASCRLHPDWLDPEADWDDSVAHLRRYSNYLSPKVGFFSADT
jgi:hypothetical protein